MFVYKIYTNFIFHLFNSIFFITIFFFTIIFLLLVFLKNNYISYSINKELYELIKKIILFLFLANFFLVISKFIIYITIWKSWLMYVIVHTQNHKILLEYLNYFVFGTYSNIVGYGLLVLCYCTSFLSLIYLGDRDIFKKGTSLQYFTFFLICTTIMVSTTNLLLIFISFEFIFLPSLYFVYSLGYVKKVDKAIYFLLIWTLFGSFLILFNFAYLYTLFYTLDYKILLTKKFLVSEYNILYSLFFIGFSTKLPIFPFHYWLTKVHVEAPAGFSMFLSGFLVKTALYCFYYINLLFSASTIKFFFIVWLCFCIIEASIKMWVQVDLKKLIAFATIQEMNMLMLCVLMFQNIHNNIIVIFLLMHGLLSTLMFFLVDQVQKRAQTRNIQMLGGFGSNYPLFRFYSWIMLLLYFGLPLTVKFIIEWNIGILLILNINFFGMFIFFLAIFFGSVGFARNWFYILYGQPSEHVKSLHVTDMFTKDSAFIYILVFMLFFLNFIIFLI